MVEGTLNEHLSEGCITSVDLIQGKSYLVSLPWPHREFRSLEPFLSLDYVTLLRFHCLSAKEFITTNNLLIRNQFETPRSVLRKR